jgi:hypothetical protein
MATPNKPEIRPVYNKPSSASGPCTNFEPTVKLFVVVLMKKHLTMSHVEVVDVNTVGRTIIVMTHVTLWMGCVKNKTVLSENRMGYVSQP